MTIRLAAASALLAGLLVSSAHAQSGRVPTQVPVSLNGVDFSQPASTVAFYARLRTAARRACDSNMGRDLAAKLQDRACAVEALDRAVAQVDKPTLLALHAGRTGQAAPSAMLASN
jgi:UrcA family protein